MDEYQGKTYYIDGKKYHFDFCVFINHFNEICRTLSKSKTEYLGVIADFMKKSVDTIDGWRKKKNSPQSIDDIKQIAVAFNMDYMRLLIPEKEEENKMNGAINTDAKNAARRLYEEFCDLIDSLEWREFDPSIPDDGPNHTNPHIKALGLKSHEDYRHYIHELIRKSTLDLSAGFRRELDNFVDRCVGPVDYQYPLYQYFDTDEYRDFCKKNNTTDNVDNRYIFSVDHQQNMYDELNIIFKDYICQ